MRLKKLEVYGFKTFANRAEFLFHSGITAVVGPNGSGKSNVADAIRWALGEQSYSALRTKKTEDLIFGGSASRPRMGMAEVALTLENPLALIEPDPDPQTPSSNGGNGNGARHRTSIVEEILYARPTEVTILRRAYRSGENEYLINRQRVRLRDVQELLQRWGLSRNTYAVVGQGLIDAALALRAEERRALFEEAAGIGLYQSKKQNALEKIEETQRNLLRVNDIINEITPRLPSLARQADRASKYETVAHALEEKLKQWYAFQWARAQENYARTTGVEAEKRERLNAHRAQVHDLAAQLSDARKHAHQLRNRLTEHRRARAQQESEYGNRERELAVLEERERFAQEQVQDAERELQQILSEREAYELQIDAARVERTLREHQRAIALARQRLAESRVADVEETRPAAGRGGSTTDPRDLAKSLAELQDELPLYEGALRSVAGLAARAESLAHAELIRRERERKLDRARRELNDAKTALALAEREVQAARLGEEIALQRREQLEEQIELSRARVHRLAHQAELIVERRASLRAEVEQLESALRTMLSDLSPDESALIESERLQNELEEQEAATRAQLMALEEAYNRAVLDAERSRAEIARLESEIEDDLGPIELSPWMAETESHSGTPVPRQLSLRLAVRRNRALAGSDENDTTAESEQAELVALPEVAALPDNFEKEIRRLKNQMKYIGNVNPSAPQEYAELKERHAFLTEQASDLTHAIERLKQATAELDEIMKQRFEDTFHAINIEFKKYFTLLFGGGTARLELTEPDNLVQTGVEITAKPPGKRAAHLAILSGGERSLTACALLFAILRVSPTPFCVLDEVDAMLDEANVDRFRDALRELASDTQFIVITHNRATIESANTVYGISMGDDGVSQVLSMRLEETTRQ